jgi:hypothetical protein
MTRAVTGSTPGAGRGVSAERVREFWAQFDKCTRCGAAAKMCCRVTHILSNHKRAATRPCPNRPTLEKEEG